MTYDKGGNVLTVTQSGKASNVPWAVPATTQTTLYHYNAAGQRDWEQVTTASGEARKSTFAYDTRGLLVAGVSPRGNATGADPVAFTTRLLNDEPRADLPHRAPRPCRWRPTAPLRASPTRWASRASTPSTR